MQSLAGLALLRGAAAAGSGFWRLVGGSVIGVLSLGGPASLSGQLGLARLTTPAADAPWLASTVANATAATAFACRAWPGFAVPGIVQDFVAGFVLLFGRPTLVSDAVQRGAECDRSAFMPVSSAPCGGRRSSCPTPNSPLGRSSTGP